MEQAPPFPVPDPGPRLRRGTSSDLAAVARIQAESPSASQWDPAEYLAYEFRVAETEEGVLGFLVARVVAEGETELLNLAVAPGMRRRGIGRALLQELRARHRGSLYLEVRESQEGTIKFYKINGFTEAGRRPDYYRDPVEGAVVMKNSSW